ncbi:amidohydrolase family protein [Papillibacter cinnamivorans]|uniref:Predicted metal-dependent hydrolase, TIM-barrel fold n=1 Tax=Papillibacter cinnamivorans DSM 12816 TaxID=1122930 RepID=A0A1W2BIH0_9FIRM|nr:amidohydrolase family protein [Papillibacter cinnamivorans]SMC72248.1 Predicted metal-dependent hydrolase, TIM-barrel fold [Papillibacter cinnamivorans DSM 12816]
MVIDCHYHYYPDEFDLMRKRAEMKREGIDKIALMGQINPFFSAELGEEVLAQLQAALGHKEYEPMLKGVIADFTEKGIRMGGVEYPIFFEPDNEGVFAACDKAPDLLYGWVLVCPKGKINPVEELKRWEKHPAFIGVKAHPFYHHYAVEALEPVARRLQELKKPMILHLAYDQFENIRKIALAHPDMPVILAHAAFPDFFNCWESLAKVPNMYVDLSSDAYLGEAMTVSVVKALGPDKCMFGTDGPFGIHRPDGTFDIGFIKRRLERLFPDKEVQQKLLGGTFARLIGVKA